MYGVMRCKCSANFNDGVVKQRAAGSLRAKGQTHDLENKQSLWCGLAWPLNTGFQNCNAITVTAPILTF